MADNATDLLSKAIASQRQATILDKAPSKSEEKTEEKEEPQRYKVRCTHCHEMMDLNDNDLLPYRTDDATSETGDSDEDNSGDSTDDDDELTEEEREEYAKDPKSALSAAIAKAAKRDDDNADSNHLDSKVAALKQKYSDRVLNIPEQIMIKRGIDPFEED